LLLELARAFGASINVTRDTPDNGVKAAYRKVMLKVHPDKPGGSAAAAKRLNNAWDRWNEANRTGKGQAGRPTGGQMAAAPTRSQRKKKEFRVQSKAVMLTYQSFDNTDVWDTFLTFVRAHLEAWAVKHWCATLETNSDGAYHLHLMLQFRTATDRAVSVFVFEDKKPNASTNDYCGEALWGKKPQQSVDRGFFYVFANKVGTVVLPSGKLCVDGDYKPCWTKSQKRYRVLGKWAETLWKERKLTHTVYEKYVYLCRDAVLSRKRNLDAVTEWEQAKRSKKAIAKRIDRIRGNSELYRQFPEVPAARAWLRHFEKDALRYPIMVVIGASFTGKTEWVKSLFRQPLELEVGHLTHFPEKMRSFDRDVHDAIILDDIRDLLFLAQHQEKLQGKYDKEVEFASTAGGTCAYQRDLFAVPIVATVNFSTKNLDALDGLLRRAG